MDRCYFIHSLLISLSFTRIQDSCAEVSALYAYWHSQYPEQWGLHDSARICQVKSYSSSKSSALLQRPHCELPSAFCLLELSLGFLHSTDTWCIFHFYFCWVIVEKSNLITTGFQKLVCLHPWIPLLCFSYSSQTKQWVWLCCLA